jgi:arsenate reductase
MEEKLPLILVVCTGNSCRSQMAHAFLSKALAGVARVESAGSEPSGYVHPVAVQVMAEKGYDLSKAESQHVDQFTDEPIAAVVTVCSHARDKCPCMTSSVCYHWEFEDPADAKGSELDVLNAFRSIRDQIEKVFLSRLDMLLPS